MDIDLGKELGAIEESSGQRLTLYIPNKDKEGRILSDHEQWVQEARELLSQIGGGTTALPPADGTWVDEQGKTLWEQTRIVYCYILPSQFRENLKDLREFLHRFGRQTNQGEVVAEFDGRFYRIRNFDQQARS